MTPTPSIVLNANGVNYPVKSLDLTWSWGARPASAIVEFPSDELIGENSPVVITCRITNNAVTGAPLAGVSGGPAPGYAVFYGICEQEAATDSSAGQINTMKFVDMRTFLSWDQVFGFFNRRQDLLVNGVWSKRYSHLLPANQAANLITYTPGPYTAAQILDFIFTAPTVNYAWVRLYHPVQVEAPVYDVDCSTGRKIADVITEISNRQGLVFTLLGGQWQLVWAQKGIGYIPGIDVPYPENSDHRRLGTALSGLPSAVTIFGGRNRYQCLDIPMEADWNAALVAEPIPGIGPGFGGTGFGYVNFESTFVDYVFNYMTDPFSGNPYNRVIVDDPEFITGKMLAKSRAETITIGELADFIDSVSEGGGENYRDRRKFNGRTRLDMPVMVYVRLLVFRAFMLPSDFQIRTGGLTDPATGETTGAGLTLGALSCRIVPTTLVETTYDYVSGEMSFVPETAPGGNGLAIVQGFNFMTPPPVTFASDRFNLTDWQNTQKLWQRVNFQIDDTGDQTQFIILDEPVAVSNDLMTVIDGHGTLNAQATFETPQVMASLVFEAERFQYSQGVAGGVNAVENVADLQADYVCGYGQTNIVPSEPARPVGSPPIMADGIQEQLFADGLSASQKAASLANYLLMQQPVYVLGGYTNRGNNGTQLSGTFDRVRLLLNAESGLTEEVDFTNERAANVFEPERDFERRIQLLQLAPGQQEMRMNAREIWGTVAALRQNPDILKLLVKAFHDRYGSASPLVQIPVTDGSGALEMGTPMWRPAPVNDPEAGLMDGTQAVMPAASDATDTPVFAGATVRDQEPVNATQELALQREGWGLVRVMGPAAVGDTLVMEAGKDYLLSMANPAADSTAPACAELQQAVPDTAVHLVMCQFGTGTGATQCF